MSFADAAKARRRAPHAPPPKTLTVAKPLFKRGRDGDARLHRLWGGDALESLLEGLRDMAEERLVGCMESLSLEGEGVQGMEDDSDDDKAFREAFDDDFSEIGEEVEAQDAEEEGEWSIDVSQEKFSDEEGDAFEEEEEEEEEGEEEEEEHGAVGDCGRLYLHLEATDWLDSVEAGM